MGELRHNLLRVIANFGRFGANLVFGLLLVRLLLQFGGEVYSVVILLGTTIGYFRLFPDVVQQSIIHELVSAYHREEEPEALVSVFAAAIRVGLITAGVMVLGIVLFVALLHAVFDIPPALHGAARFMALCIGLQTVAVALSAPSFNMLNVWERFAEVNTWMVAQRVTFPSAALAVTFMDLSGEADRIVAYGFLSTLLFLGVLLAAVIRVHRREPRLRLFHPEYETAVVKRMLLLGGWNTAANVALMVQTVFSSVLMNRFFGLTANGMFGLALQLGNYVRIIAHGMAGGLDTISARFGVAHGDEGIRKLLYYAGLAHTWAVMSVFPLLMLYPQQILQLWIGPAEANPEIDYGLTANLIRLFAFGAMFTGIADGWIKLLIGAGRAAGYARALLLITGFGIPASLLLALFGPEWLRFYSLSFPYTLFYPCLGLPAFVYVLARWSGSRPAQILAPLARVLGPVSCGVAGLFAVRALALPAPWGFLLAVAAHLGLYALSSWFLLVDAGLRGRIQKRVLARFTSGTDQAG
ncbi:hypothetical protein [Acanthopleuribacter pedis]|uniref:Polysaccharide biosynthesis protein n=1 Tax=Acanthopleuribacter pedis TaxID=442870 RepID=A0A8J7U0R8_9BACT|nr:hypothetical protein [Acanthopleuribacter pedis]MBO1317358.1 hypothetical protein [Acanthopleuribacter pedis]MBO1318665.1 hypothetical protein [Acanthopleuribacter pedis]